MKTIILSLLLAIRGAVPLPPSGPPPELPVFGLVEQVRLYPGEIDVRAKLDTGADNSSLHAVGISRFKRKGEKWVHFQTLDENGEPAFLNGPWSVR